MSAKEIKEMFKMSPGAILENYKFMQKELEQLDKYKQVIDKIKELLEKYNDKETNMYAPIQECLELLEEIE